MISILDACSLIAYLEGEVGSEVVESLLADESELCYVHSVNLCEVYYHVVRRSDLTVARDAIDSLLADGLVERPDFDRDFWERAGQYKARGRISLADCICLALAVTLGGRVVTSDHGEFDPIAESGVCPILFIR